MIIKTVQSRFAEKCKQKKEYDRFAKMCNVIKNGCSLFEAFLKEGSWVKKVLISNISTSKIIKIKVTVFHFYNCSAKRLYQRFIIYLNSIESNERLKFTHIPFAFCDFCGELQKTEK